jgi:rubrerythrin
MESMIEDEIEHRRRVNEIYEMLKDGKEKSEDRKDDEQ